MSFVLKFYKTHFDTIVTGSPDVQLGTIETVVIANDFSSSGTAVIFNPGIKCRLHITEVVGRSLNM